MILQPKHLILESSDKTFGNMSIARGNPDEVFKNRKNFLSKLGITLNDIVIMAPYHRGRVLQVGKKHTNSKRVFQADALITKEKGVFLFLPTGDCIPIALYDFKNQAVGLIHGGRESIGNGIIPNTTSAMVKRIGSNPKDLAVSFGPSIGPCCYIRTYPQNCTPLLKQYIKHVTNNLFSIDIWGFAIDQLVKAGIPENNIVNPKACTYHENNYFSHRKAVEENLVVDYRFTTVIGIKEGRKLPKVSTKQYPLAQTPLFSDQLDF